MRLIGVHQGHTVTLVVDHIHGEAFLCGGVDAVVELSSKQIDPHNAEDEPEYQAHQQHIENRGNGTNQCIHYHLELETNELSNTYFNLTLKLTFKDM